MTPADLPTVHVVGLGPAGPDLVTAGTLELVARVPVRFLRTVRHPAAVVLEGSPSFDHHYESADRIEEVYAAVVEDLVDAAATHGEVLYAVPGSPVVAERTVELLLADDRVQAQVHAALSFADLTWVRLGVDPVAAGVRLVDAHRFEVEAAGERGPLLVCQCDSQFVLSDVKLAVDDAPAAPVVVLQRLGLPDEAVFPVAWEDLDREVVADHLTSLWVPEMAAPVAGEVARLVALVRRLRTEDPWKAEQTHRSLQPYLVEESYEVLEALDRMDPASGDGSDELAEELGDLLYQVVLHAVLGAEAGWFDLAQVADGIYDKLVARHPHLFDPAAAGGPAPTVADLVAGWEAAKQAEKSRGSRYDGIPPGLPALTYAAKVARKAGSATPPAPPAHPAPTPPAPAATEAEVARALLDLVDAAVAAGVDPEGALRRAVDQRVAALRTAEAADGPTADETDATAD